MRIMFLGAGKRVSLLRAFVRAGAAEAVDLDIAAVERSTIAPISDLARIIVGPSFGSPEFAAFLLEAVQSLQIDVVVPNMDAATVALAACSDSLVAAGCWPVVSSLALCEAMFDKSLASDWFARKGIPQPPTTGYPRIAKLRRGFGSRGQFVAGDEAEFAAVMRRRDSEEYFVQGFVEGQEYSVDAYVDRTGHLTAALSRKRLEVSGGEVDVSEVSRHDAILKLTETILAEPGWLGPVTLQFIDGAAGPVVIEVNPRFGGGVTHAIHCGLDMPAWLIRERLGRALPVPPRWTDGSIMTRFRGDVFHDRER
jgi:carbamoyl-phosphate synthase large subunit